MFYEQPELIKTVISLRWLGNGERKLLNEDLCWQTRRPMKSCKTPGNVTLTQGGRVMLVRRLRKFVQDKIKRRKFVEEDKSQPRL